MSEEAGLVERRKRTGASAWSRVSITALATLVVLLGVAIIGPIVSPRSATAIVGSPLQSPDPNHWLGTDALGRDVLSRVMHGGRTLVTLASIATIAVGIIGLGAGVTAGISRGWIDNAIMRTVDVMLPVPSLILLLLLAALLGPGTTTVVIAVTIVNIPQSIRVVRAATLEIAGRAFIEAARLRGESYFGISVREVVPNIATTVAADLGVRLTLAILLIASANFLGLGLQPPTADWGVMVAENRIGLRTQPWAILVPAFLIAVLAVSINVLSDSLLRDRSQGKSLLT